jgi:RNA polymerase sigma-70 factor (ECF subfamily)
MVEPPSDLETTQSLLFKVRSGDEAARERLYKRYMPGFRRWAHGRLPSNADGMKDTDDLINETFTRAFRRIDDFEHRRSGGFLAYLRKTYRNLVKDEIKRAQRAPGLVPLGEDLQSREPSQIEKMMADELHASYEKALTRLTEAQREAFLMRIELGFSHAQVAEALGCRTWEAARMLVARALVRMALAMRKESDLRGTC